MGPTVINLAVASPPLGLPVGAVPYGLFLLALVYFLVSQMQMFWLSTSRGVFFLWGDARTRFFVLFGVLMLAILVTCFGYGLYVLEGFGLALDRYAPAAWFVLAWGIIPLPIIVVELLTINFSDSIGIIRNYEDNLLENGWKTGDLVKRLEGWAVEIPLLRQWFYFTVYRFLLRSFTLSAYIWLFRVNWQANQRRLASRTRLDRFIQGELDVLMTALYFLSLVACLIGLTSWWGGSVWLAQLLRVFFSNSLSISYSCKSLFLFMTIVILSPAMLLFLRANPDSSRKRAVVAILGRGRVYVGVGALLILSIWRDFFWFEPGWNKINELVYARQESFGDSLQLLLGGYLTIPLIVVILHLFFRFQDELVNTWSSVGATLSARMPVSMADQAMHHFGNVLLNPEFSLKEIEDVLAEASFTEDGVFISTDDYAYMKERCSRGLGALEHAKELVQEFKVGGRLGKKDPQWHLLAPFLSAMAERSSLCNNLKFIPENQDVPKNLEILVDQHLLGHVLTNLLDNAISALESGRTPGATITLSVCYEKANGYPLTLFVGDNGPGVPEKFRDHIFDAHFSTTGKGSGLGLYIAREFMEDMGGEIRLLPSTQDRYGKTVFGMFFPRSCVRESILNGGGDLCSLPEQAMGR